MRKVSGSTPTFPVVTASTGGPSLILPLTLLASLMLIGSGVAALAVVRRSTIS